MNIYKKNLILYTALTDYNMDSHILYMTQPSEKLIILHSLNFVLCFFPRCSFHSSYMGKKIEEEWNGTLLLASILFSIFLLLL